MCRKAGGSQLADRTRAKNRIRVAALGCCCMLVDLGRSCWFSAESIRGGQPRAAAAAACDVLLCEWISGSRNIVLHSTQMSCDVGFKGSKLLVLAG